MFLLTQKYIQLNLALIIVGLSFYLGIRVYIADIIKKNESPRETKELRPKLEKALLRDFYIQTGEKSLVVKKEEVKNWIETYTRNYSGKEDLRISTAKVISYLESLAPLLNIEPVNAKFVINNGRAETFQLATSGKKLKISESTALITSSIINGQTSASLAFDQIEPDLTLDKINNLGITTLL